MAKWQPAPDEIVRVLTEQNPWHANGEVPEALAPRTERPLARYLWRLVDPSGASRRAHVILGPRRVGKTTVMYQTVRRLLASGVEATRIWWLRMDHPFLLREPLGDLARRVVETTGAAAGREVFLFLDELVYATDWDLWLKTFHDERWPVRVVASSSATAALRGRHRESGIGRWDEHLLLPLQLVEYLDLLGLRMDVPVAESLAATLPTLPARLPDPAEVASLRRRFLLTGGFPELLREDVDRPGVDEATRTLRSQQRLRDEAVERAIYKDIPQSFGIDNPMLLERLLYVLAGQVTGILSPSAIGTQLDGMSQPTFDRYVSYLEQTFLVFRTLGWSGSEGAVQRRGRKVFFLDGAVRNAELQRGLAPLQDPVELGLLHENLVAAALHGLALLSGHRLHHWREGRWEVDFVIHDPAGAMAFEVASSMSHSRAGLVELVRRHPRLAAHAYLVSPDAPLVRPDPQRAVLGALPLDLFLVAVGRQAEAALAQRLSAGTLW